MTTSSSPTITHIHTSKELLLCNRTSIIAAVSAVDGSVGKSGELCFRIPEDLKRFKELTKDTNIVMGGATYRSLPNGALPYRKNIVLSRQDPMYFPLCSVANSEERLMEILDYVDGPIFIIGGHDIWKMFLDKDLVGKMYLTEIHERCPEADTFFPKGWSNNFECISREPRLGPEGIYYEFTEYRKVHILQ